MNIISSDGKFLLLIYKILILAVTKDVINELGISPDDKEIKKMLNDAIFPNSSTGQQKSTKNKSLHSGSSSSHSKQPKNPHNRGGSSSVQPPHGMNLQTGYNPHVYGSQALMQGNIYPPSNIHYQPIVNQMNGPLHGNFPTDYSNPPHPFNGSHQFIGNPVQMPPAYFYTFPQGVAAPTDPTYQNTPNYLNQPPYH
uniref:Uncharacterized protein n=1 Tax=Meloidogyne javanica TaxID=6303 RepID=A0A915LCI9_MELJA